MATIHLLTFLLILGVSNAYADHEVFRVGSMRNADPSAAVITSTSGTCVPSHDRDKLECYFTAFALWQAKSAEDMKKELDELARTMTQFSAAQLAEANASYCADRKKFEPDPLLLKYNVPYSALIVSMKAFCERPCRETALDLLRTIVLADAKKCNCVVTDWRSTFSRHGDRWVSHSGPSGLCGVIKVFTLVPYDLKKMREPLGPMLWTLHEKTVTTHDSDNKFCGKGPLKIEEGSMTMTWNAPTKTLDCREVEFTSGLESMTDPTRR